jgi:hypothetical protein
VKNSTAKQIRHNFYSHDEAKWMNKQRVKDNAKRHKRKLSKRDIMQMIEEEV